MLYRRVSVTPSDRVSILSRFSVRCAHAVVESSAFMRTMSEREPHSTHTENTGHSADTQHAHATFGEPLYGERPGSFAPTAPWRPYS